MSQMLYFSVDTVRAIRPASARRASWGGSGQPISATVTRAACPLTPVRAHSKPVAWKAREQCQSRQHTRGNTACPSATDWSDGASSEDPAWSISKVLDAIHAFYKFTRPHTMLGTTVSILSVSLLALQGHALNAAAVGAVGQAVAAALMANVSIVGLNQVFDVEIDRVNKPYLPLASGEFSLNTGIAIVGLTAVAALGLSYASGSPALLWTVAISLVLGVVYSTDLPFMRWKRFPVLAASCILAVRAIIVQLGFYFHVKHALGTAQITLTRPLTFTIGFMLLFSIVIALFKDIPDVKGDNRAGVRTLSVRLGVPRVFWACTRLLLAAYASGVVFSLTCSSTLSTVVTCGGHLLPALVLWSRARQINLRLKDHLVDHYMFIWKLFYAEYLVIPFFS